MDVLPGVEYVSSEPLYNIGVVSRMTGISMATLRAWERRYDFPESHRTAGGHRLYSERDILRLRWVRQRVGEGMQTAQAIQALRHQEQTGHAILTEQMLPGGSSGPIIPEYKDSDRGETNDDRRVGMQERLLHSLIQRDLQQADTILSDAMAVFSTEELILSLIAPTLARLGDLWEAGELGVSAEHLATNYLRHRLLMWMVGGPPAQQVPPIMLACAPEEWHDGSLLILGALLRRRRWPVAYLGQSVPLPDLAQFVSDVKPIMVAFVAMTEKTALNLVEWPAQMPEVARSGKPIIAYGGRAFALQPEMRLKMQGFYLGSTFEEGVFSIERLIQPPMHSA